MAPLYYPGDEKALNNALDAHLTRTPPHPDDDDDDRDDEIPEGGSVCGGCDARSWRGETCVCDYDDMDDDYDENFDPNELNSPDQGTGEGLGESAVDRLARHRTNHREPGTAERLENDGSLTL